jgi:hypothetical protein
MIRSHRRLLLATITGIGLAAIATAQPVPGVAFAENFDGVAAPALPPGWVATNDQGPDPLWVTDGTSSETAPNSAHVEDPDAVSDKRLDSPPILIQTNQAVLYFQHRKNFAIGDTGAFFDGGVLEISIDGGAFQDIVAAGGYAHHDAFQIEGQNNPLNGRSGWVFEPTSYDFSEERVTLPPVGGHTIVLRWRLGSGGGVAVNIHPGWWIDSVKICDGADCDTVPSPRRMDVDTAGNGVWEIGELVDVDPYYYNSGAGSLNLSGSVTSVTGTGDPGLYELIDDSASTTSESRAAARLLR